jgi:hypothetical protein
MAFQDQRARDERAARDKNCAAAGGRAGIKGRLDFGGLNAGGVRKRPEGADIEGKYGIHMMNPTHRGGGHGMWFNRHRGRLSFVSGLGTSIGKETVRSCGNDNTYPDVGLPDFGLFILFSATLVF